MESFKRFVLGPVDRGDVLVLSLGCLIALYLQYFPSFWGPFSVGIITVGALFARYIKMDYRTTNENVRYQELLRELEKRLPDVEEHLHSSEYHGEYCFLLRVCLKAMRRDSSLVEDGIPFLERLLKETEEISSYASRTLETLGHMRNGEGLYSATHSEEDIAVVNNLENEGQTDAGNMQQEEQQTQQEDEGEKRHEKIPEILLKEILEAERKGLRKDPVIVILQKLLENLIRQVSKEQPKITKIAFEKESAALVRYVKLVKQIPTIYVAAVIGKKLFAGELPMQKIFKKISIAEKKRLQKETAEEVLGEKATGEVEGKKKSEIVIAKAVLEVVAANNALMQEIVKIALENATTDMPGIEKFMVVTEGNATRKMTVEEVTAGVLKDRCLIKDALKQIFVSVLRIARERKD